MRNWAQELNFQLDTERKLEEDIREREALTKILGVRGAKRVMNTRFMELRV
jgi:hypothetical protein